MHLMDLARVNILGVGVSASNLKEAVATVEGWISRNEPNYVCVREGRCPYLC